VLDYCGKSKVDLGVFARTYVHNPAIDPFGNFIAYCHLYLSRAFELPRSKFYYLLRVIDGIKSFCEKEKVDIEEAIQIKHEYNKSRPYRHGGKKI
jgi:hypothetical protein